METRMFSFMKWFKDRMGNSPTDTEIKTLCDRAKELGATHVEVATVIGHPNFVSITSRAVKIIHTNNLFVTFRNAHMNMEFTRNGDGSFSGLYGSETWIGGRRKDPQVYLDAAKSMITEHPDWYKDGDEFALYPERTEGIFSDNTSWISPATPENFASFFIKLYDMSVVEFVKINKKVQCGLTANNGSELLGGWLPKSYVEKVGYAVIDHYRDDRTPVQYEADIDNIFNRYGKPIYIQEWAFHRHASNEQNDTQPIKDYYAMFVKKYKEGKLKRFGYWGGWPAAGEGALNGDLTLNWKGKLLKEFYGQVSTGTPTPTPPNPDPTPTPPTEPSIGKELLDTPWKLEGNNGASEKDKPLSNIVLKDVKKVEVTFNLHGTRFGLGLDEASVIFIQDGIWYMANIVKAGKNEFDGEQKVSIPVDQFNSVNGENKLKLDKPVSNIHSRFWNSKAFIADIKSVKLIGEGTTPPTPNPEPTPPNPQPTTQVVIVDPTKIKDIQIILKPS